MTDLAPVLDPEARPELLLTRLGARRDALSGREAARRLQQLGPNVIVRRAASGPLRRLAAQFTHPLALLLWAAGALAFVSGTAPLGLAILAVIVLNALFARAQERQAERATEALAAFLPPVARAFDAMTPWETAQGGHTGALGASPHEYEQRVLSFFDHALLTRPTEAP